MTLITFKLIAISTTTCLLQQGGNNRRRSYRDVEQRRTEVDSSRSSSEFGDGELNF